MVISRTSENSPIAFADEEHASDATDRREDAMDITISSRLLCI
ncbi:unnamed protein product [Gongylonema pulchrum]|uniref:Uncharacterized protein n=1 Tax=Gongylonema pulchrum TaxID=637853 RepID=A0A183F119_9BILA|nr:unnamed protein product [Gongylonema pulchrum]